MSDNDNEKKRLEALLAESTDGAKTAEFLKKAEAKLEELVNAAKTEEDKYRADFAELNKTWSEQEEVITKHTNYLDKCYPKWSDYIEECVCEEAIKPLWELKGKSEQNIGQLNQSKNLADTVFDSASQELDAWKSISSWIKAQLDKNKKLIDELCTLDNCEDKLFGLYILHFELLPAHRKLEKVSTDVDYKYKHPEHEYCKKSLKEAQEKEEVRDSQFPYLIDPDDYNVEVANLWKAWRNAGEEQVKAECELTKIEKYKDQYAGDSSSEEKRKKARLCLRRKSNELVESVSPSDSDTDQSDESEPESDSDT